MAVSHNGGHASDGLVLDQGIKALLFDHDGSIMEYPPREVLLEAYTHICGKAGVDPPWPSGGLREFMGWWTADYHYNYERLGVPMTREMILRLNGWFYEIWNRDEFARVRREHIAEVFEATQSRGLRLGIVTSAMMHVVLQDLDGSRGLFECIISSDVVKSTKPDPLGLRMGMLGLEVEPHEVAFVGDDVVDVQAAVNAGVLPIGVTGGLRERGELEAAGAEHVVTLQDLARAIAA